MITIDPQEIPGNTATERFLLGTYGIDADYSRIDNGFDRDWFRIELLAGESYFIRVQSARYMFDALGLPEGTTLLTSPAVSVYSPATGYIPLAQRDDEGAGGDYAFLVFTPATSGTYYVEASSAAGGAGAYQVSAGPLDWIAPVGIASALGSSAGSDLPVDAAIILGTQGGLPYAGRGTAVLYKGEGPSRSFVTEFNFNAPSAANITLSWSDYTVTLDPPGALEAGTVYTVSVREDFLRNLVDTPSTAYEFTFRTAGGNPGNGDDHPNEAASGTAINVGTPTDGLIEAARDVDWFRVALTAGASYTITLDRTDAAATLDPFLVLEHPDGTTVTNDDAAPGNRNARLEFTAPISGSYALRASDIFQQKTGAYRIAVEERVIDDHGNDAGTATAISAGADGSGTLEREGDTDWFRIDLDPGREYTFSLRTDTAAGGLESPRLSVLDAYGTTLGTAMDDLLTNPAPSLTLKSPSGGAHFIEVASNLASDMTGSYSLRVDEVDDRPDDRVDLLPIGGSVTGRIAPADDRDRFWVELLADSTYTFRLDRTAGALVPLVTLVAPDGTTTSIQSQEGGSTSELRFTATTGGRHQLIAGNLPGQGSGDYTLSAVEIDALPGVTKIRLGDTVRSRIETGDDRDLFRFDSPWLAGISEDDRVAFLLFQAYARNLPEPRILEATVRATNPAETLDPGMILASETVFGRIPVTINYDLSASDDSALLRWKDDGSRLAISWVLIVGSETGTSTGGYELTLRELPAGTPTTPEGFGRLRFARELWQEGTLRIEYDQPVEYGSGVVTIVLRDPGGEEVLSYVHGVFPGYEHPGITKVENGIAIDVDSFPEGWSLRIKASEGSFVGTTGLPGGALDQVIRSSQMRVQDGYVEGAAIFADANGNNLPEPWEDTGLITDAAGKVSGGIPDGVSLIAVGGTNIDTGLPNTLTLLAPPGGRLLNPVTTLIEFARDLSGVDTAEASDRIAAALGLETGIDFLTYDPLAQPPDDPTALAVQKAAVQVAVIAGAIGNSAVNLARIAVLAADAEQALDLTQAATLAAMLEIETDDPLVALVASGLGAIDQATTLSAVAEAQAAATVALDLEILPRLSISTETVSVVEGNFGSTALVFRVERSGDVAAESSVRWTVEGDPVDASDFVGGALPSGTLDFAAGETSKTITVAVVGDTMFEGDEAVTVRLTEASGARIDAATARITVLNDDTLPSLSIAPAAASRAEGDDGATEFTFTVTRTGDTSIASSAAWAASSANATGADFAGGVLPAGTVSFVVGETSRTITVAVTGDTEFETDEAFTVTLTAPSGATLVNVSATGTIVNDDSAVVPGTLVNGTSGNDPALTGGAGNDTINGLAGADTLTGLGGDDILDGGSGPPGERDTAVFSGPIAGYTLARTGPTLTIADATAGRDGTDTTVNLERLLFSDMGVNLTVQATAASIAPTHLDRICELYLGFFARVPAADGLENWVNQFKNGKSLNTIADDFYGIGSSEALRSVTGYWDFANNRELSNEDFVRIAYRNVLGREGLEGGISYWAAQLTGPDAKTRGELVGTMLDAARGLTGDATWGWVAELLDDKVTMSKHVAVDWGLNYGANANEAIAKGVQIANALDESPNPNPIYVAIPVKTFDVDAATALIGINPASIDLVG